MNGKQPRRSRRKAPRDERARDILKALLADKGWTAGNVADESERTGHPDRAVSKRTVERMLLTASVPGEPLQFEIASTFATKVEVGGRRHLLPSHIWGPVPLPAPYDHLNVIFQPQTLELAA